MGTAKAANLITNGSFEVDLVPSAGLSIYPSSGTPGLTGWTVGGSDVLVVNTLYSELGLAFPAEDGIQWADLTGAGSNSPLNKISQDVSGLNIGTLYTLNFFVGSVSILPSTIIVSLGGVPQGSFTNPSATTTLQWEKFGVNFIPTSTSENIAFFNGSASNNGLSALDNITLDLADNPVPSPTVPGPLPLLGVGAAFGLSRKLRQRIATAQANSNRIG